MLLGIKCVPSITDRGDQNEDLHQRNPREQVTGADLLGVEAAQWYLLDRPVCCPLYLRRQFARLHSRSLQGLSCWISPAV
jgi:hypothetical protein